MQYSCPGPGPAGPDLILIVSTVQFGIERLLTLFDITPVSMLFGFAFWGDTDNAVYLGPLHIIRSVSR